jgi:hypothetical protein
MRAQEARVGMKVRVLPKHRIEERRGMVERVMGCYAEKSTWRWMCALRTGNASCFGLEIWRIFPLLLGHGGVRCSVSTVSVAQ